MKQSWSKYMTEAMRLASFMSVSCSAASRLPEPVIHIERPTVIAVFGRPTEKIETDEASNDFYIFIQKAKPKLKEAGVDFHEVLSRTLSIVVAGKRDDTAPPSYGYYFVAPYYSPQFDEFGTDCLQALSRVRQGLRAAATSRHPLMCLREVRGSSPELAHVARPRIPARQAAAQALQHLRRQRVILRAGDAGNEPPHEQLELGRRFADALAQRRHLDEVGAQAIEEILAEPPVVA